MKIIVRTDGGSIGNPGPSAIGIVIEYDGQKKTYAKDIGMGTNNEAEYKALAFALRKLKALLGSQKSKKADVKCFADSQLMVNQLNHKYHLKNKKIISLFIEIWNLMLEYKNVEFAHVPREENREADGLVRSVIGGGKQNSFFK